MELKIIGDKEIQRTLKALPLALNHSIQQKANVQAAKPLIEKEKLLAPEGPTGNLVDSIGYVLIPLKKASEIGEIHVGPRRRGRYRGFHAQFVEFGTKSRELKSGANRGKMPSTPFIRPAFQVTKDKVIASMQDNMLKVLVRTMKKNLGSSFIP